ncbi:MAG: copper homeostasis protein CutC [Terracidiphilus sp.]|nr:copper homeostasis protein CutC [Terracidiphilus sp.]
MTLEVCIDSVESALAAERGGAARVELCSDLLEGGLTPGAGLIATIRRHISIALFVMIRCRGGDFCPSELEFEAMREEIAQARQLGANGVVLGLLNPDASIDVVRTRKLVELAAPLPVTFHRAVDMTPDPIAALEDVIETGATRILSSGGRPQAVQGASTLARMVTLAGPRISVMVGGSVTSENIAALVYATGAHEFHSSARQQQTTPMLFHKRGMALGELKECEYRRSLVSEKQVRAMVAGLAACKPSAAGV